MDTWYWYSVHVDSIYILETGSSDISPSMLHKYMSFIEQQAPDIGRVHQLR